MQSQNLKGRIVGIGGFYYYEPPDYLKKLVDTVACGPYSLESAIQYGKDFELFWAESCTEEQIRNLETQDLPLEKRGFGV